ncbi:MAG TPA: TQO small subunit DoxD [Pyrinomonadaceae bacterium]
MPDDLLTRGNSSAVARCESARIGMAIMRLGLGAMFLYVFFENLSKGLYSKDGYSGLIGYYLAKGHAPGFWKNIMSLAASHAATAGPMQAVTEIGFGLFLLLGLLTRPVALAAFLFLTSLWISEWGTAWIWELLVPMIAAFSIMMGGAGRKWGIDAALSRKYPRLPLW